MVQTARRVLRAIPDWWPRALAAGLAGWVASYWDLQILPGLSVIFSGIFYLIAAISLGPMAGTVAAAIAMARTVTAQGHAYSLILSVVEAAAIGYMARKKKPEWPPAAALLFWTVIGFPFLVLITFVLLSYAGVTGWTIVLKRCLVGFLDAVVADFLLLIPLVVRARGGWYRRAPGGLREILSTGILILTLLPISGYSLIHSRAVAGDEQQHTYEALRDIAAGVRSHTDGVIRAYVQALEQAVRGDEAPAHTLGDAQRYYPVWSWLIAARADGRIEAVRGDARGASGGFRRDLLARAIRERRPLATAVRSGASAEVVISVPFASGPQAGDLGIQAGLPADTFCHGGKSHATVETLLVDDQDRNVCAGPSPQGVTPELKTRSWYRNVIAAEEAAAPRDLNWLLRNGNPPGTAAVAVRTSLAGWRVITAQSLEPVRRAMETHYSRTLVWLMGVMILSCGFAAMIAHGIAAPIEALVLGLRDFRAGEPWFGPLSPANAPPELMHIQKHFSELSERLVETSAQTQIALEEKDSVNRDLQELLSALDGKVQKRTTELSDARARAEAANEAKSLFLASMSHEIRTPLNAIIGVADLLAAHNLGPEEQSLNEMIRTSSRGLMALINDILDFSKIESGKLELGSIEFDPRDIVESVASVVALAAHSKGIEIACRIDRDIPRAVFGDPDRLQQVLMNLASNAVKFTAAGEVGISVRVIGRGPSDATLRIEVTDTGVGIPEASQRRLFQPFTQADASTTRKFGGTGLGLAVSKKLTEQMGGTIGFASQEGRGSSFWCEFRFTVPAASATLEPVPRFDSRILIVDDNRSSREALIEDLAALGFSAEAVEDGRAALAGLLEASRRKQPFGAVVLDFDLPEHHGLPVAAAVRLEPELQGVPLLLLRSQSERLHGGANSGLEPYVPLRKPARQRKLLEALLDLGLLPAKGRISNVGSRPPSPAIPTAARQVRPRILLVEDNVVNQRVASKMLERLGYDADVAANGAIALEALDRRPYHVVLMDCQMPVMDGFEATREIRRRGNGIASTVVIAMTANAYAEDREQCRQAGMDDYLSKPVALETLADTLERWTSGAAVSDHPNVREVETL